MAANNIYFKVQTSCSVSFFFCEPLSRQCLKNSSARRPAKPLKLSVSLLTTSASLCSRGGSELFGGEYYRDLSAVNRTVLRCLRMGFTGVCT